MTAAPTRCPAAEERGATLVELLVAVAIMAVVGGGIASVAVASFRTERLVVEVREAMDGARLAVDDLRRDVRDARRVLTGSDARTLVLWHDVDADGVTDAGETITYRVVDESTVSSCPSGPTAGAARLTRQVDAGPARTRTCDLRLGDAFTYTGVPVSTVRLTLTARSRDDAEGASTLLVDEVVRVRDVP